MIKYRISLSRLNVDANIVEIEVERESDHSVWIKGNAVRKRTEWHNYFDTWEEAYQALYDHQDARCKSLRRQLEVANSKLGNIRRMKKTRVE